MKKFLAIALAALFPLIAYGDVKITQLPAGNAASSDVNSVFPYVDTTGAGVTKKLLLSDLVNVPALAAPSFCTAKPLTGFVSAPGTISSADTILSAIDKLDGNVNSIAAASVTVGPFGSSPNANGGTISLNTLTLQPADATHPGGVSTTTQTFGGSKSLSIAKILNLTTNGLVYVTGSDGTTNSGPLTGDITSSGLATTLATVNSNVGTFTNATVTVNAKGLVTAASSGTAPVTSLTVATANGFAGSSSGGSTPALTLSTTVTGLLKGNGTAISAAVAGTDYQAAGNYITALTGDVTASGPGSVAATIANSAVTNAKQANMANNTIKSNISGGSAAPSDNSLDAILDHFFGSSQGEIIFRGASGWQGLSPGSAGNALLSGGAGADVAWGTAGTSSPLTTKGDLYGYSTTNARIPVGSDGQVLTADSAQTLGVKWSTLSYGDVVGPGSASDNAITRFDGTTGKLIQNSSASLSDTGNITGATINGMTLSSGGGASTSSLSLAPSKSVAFNNSLAFSGTDGTTYSLGNGNAINALASLTPAADKIPYFTGASTAGLVTIGSGLSFSGGTLSATGGGGTVTTVSVASANGFAGTVANATTTPAITLSTTITGLLKGNGTAISAATSGTDYAPATSGSSILYGNGAGGFSNVTVGSGLSFAGGTLSASASSPTAITQSISQTSHGFSVGDIVYCTSTTSCTKAQANSPSTAEIAGMVTTVTNANAFVMTQYGYVTGLSGLTANSVYFLSDSVAGGMTLTEPTTVGYVSRPVFRSDSTTSGYFVPMRGVTITAAGGGSGYGTTSQVVVGGYSSGGSTNTKFIVFSTVLNSVGSDISYATSGTLGDSFTINTTGLYQVDFNAYSTGSQYIGIALSPTSGTTNIGSMSYANGFRAMTYVPVGTVSSVSRVISATSGQVIRAVYDGTANLDTGTNYVNFSVTRVK